MIADTGVGIPPTADARRRGTSLGLYVCKELVERMSGRISVDSEVGSGSTFTGELPRR